MSNETLSDYRILSKLGAGGMGEVHLAEDTKLDRRVAIKFLPPESVADEQARRRLVREAKAAAGLDHPSICSIYEVGEADGRSFIVMQYVEGETLAARIKRKPLELDECLEIAAQLVDGLADAHSHGIIHRDIKPANIMLTARHQAKIMDFGLAKVIRERPLKQSEGVTESLLTEPGSIVGTLPYMSPEQVRGEALDARSDIFSFGAVLYEMITGHQPFAAESAAMTISAIVTREPAPLARFSRDVPSELERIVSKALRKDRERRYQTMHDVAIDLEDQRSEHSSARDTSRREELPTASERVVVTDQSTRRPGMLTSRRALVFYSLAAVLVFAAIGYMLFRGAYAPTQPEIKSLAVIPLDNFSDDPAQDYLADGMTEALITELSKIGSLRVTSRTSVMQYKAARKPLPGIARELNVDVIVTGSVQRSGDKLGISAQLIRAATDQHLWANQYERDLRDVLSLQREVARAIAGEINVKLTPKEQGLLASGRPIKPEAVDAYLKGRDYSNRGRDLFAQQQGLDLLKTSIGYFEQAVRIDPSYALAYAGLARANHWLAGSSGSPEFYQLAREAATRALEIDDTLAEAHGALANIMMRFDRDWAGSEKEFKRAIELNPSYSDAHGGYASYLSYLGRFDQAIREINLAQELDPLPLTHKHNAGITYTFARQYDRAIDQFRQLLDTQPNNPQTHGGLGAAYVYKGMYEEGIAELRKASELSERNASMRALLAWGYAASGTRSEAIKILDESLKRLSHGGPAHPYSKVWIAAVYAALGNRDQAFAWLEKAYQERSLSLLTLKTDPAYDSLRSDPRFTDLLGRIGFPQ